MSQQSVPSIYTCYHMTVTWYFTFPLSSAFSRGGRLTIVVTCFLCLVFIFTNKVCTSTSAATLMLQLHLHCCGVIHHLTEDFLDLWAMAFAKATDYSKCIKIRWIYIIVTQKGRTWSQMQDSGDKGWTQKSEQGNWKLGNQEQGDTIMREYTRKDKGTLGQHLLTRYWGEREQVRT